MKDDKVKKETITLYDLKFENEDKYSDKKEDLKNKEKNLSKSKFYKIEDKKKEELEKVFKQVKTNIKLGFNLTKSSYSQDKSSTLPEIIYDKKTIENKNLCIIYDPKNFSKILEIEISAPFLFVEKLDNKDLVFLTSNENIYELLIYRSMQGQNNENKGYILSQKIIETIEGYEIKYNYEMNMFGEEEKPESKAYNLYYIKAISGNRFFCVSNYGFKMYALNGKNEYELVLLEPYEKIDFIYEIDSDQFIFGLNIRKVEGYGFCGNAYTCYYHLLLNIIELKDIDKNQNNSKNNNLKMNEKLKYSVISKTMFEFNCSNPLVFDTEIEFSDFVTLKNKYFIVMIEKSILIFNMETREEIKKFEINIDDYPYFQSDIKKWDCPENDEFIMIVNNNVILFKLNEEKSKNINLSILNYGYFPELCIKKTENTIIYKNLKKINGQKNRFYSYNCRLNDIFIY
jgi:hypothetical protein